MQKRISNKFALSLAFSTQHAFVYDSHIKEHRSIFTVGCSYWHSSVKRK